MIRQLHKCLLIIGFTFYWFQINCQVNKVNPKEIYLGKIKEVYSTTWVLKMKHKNWESQYLDIERGYIFNEDGTKSIFETTDYNPNGSIRYSEVFNYNKQIDKEKETLLDSLGNPIRRYGPMGLEYIQYKYSDGKIIEEIEENEKHELQFKTIYFYQDGKLIKADHFDKTGTKVNQLIFNEQGRKIEQIHCSNEEKLWYRKFFYDDKGFLIHQQEIDLKGKITSETFFEYTFDQYGNWIEELKTTGKTQYRTKREFQYYL